MKNETINKLKKFTLKPDTRNWYYKPTPPDVQIEEGSNRVYTAYDGKSIYEWNIDGQSEFQILNILQEMTMASNAYKQIGNNEIQIFKMIVSGFSGNLKGWWDNYVTD